MHFRCLTERNKVHRSDEGHRHCGRLAGPQRCVQHVAGDAGAENIADPLVQNDLDGLAGIQAAQHHGERILAGGGRLDLR